MNTLIRVQGWVTDASVIKPSNDFISPKYQLSIHPSDPSIMSELEYKTALLKRENETPYENPDYQIERTEHKDRILSGCNVLLDTIREPTLYGDLADVSRDEELLGRYVQAVGHIQIHSAGNCYLSFHILEPVAEPELIDIYVEGDEDF